MAGSTTKKAVIRRYEKEALTGYVNPGSYLQPAGVELLSTEGAILTVPYVDIRSIGFVRDFDHTGEDRQHLFFQFAMLIVQLLEVLFGCGGSAPHALEEHLHQRVAGLYLGVIEEAYEQTVASGLVLDVAHIADVEGGSFCGKLLHLGMGNVGEEGACRQEIFEPREARGPLA